MPPLPLPFSHDHPRALFLPPSPQVDSPVPASASFVPSRSPRLPRPPAVTLGRTGGRYPKPPEPFRRTEEPHCAAAAQHGARQRLFAPLPETAGAGALCRASCLNPDSASWCRWKERPEHHQVKVQTHGGSEPKVNITPMVSLFDV